MKVVIIGANGQLGSDLVPACAGWDVVALNHADLDICDAARTEQVIGAASPDVVINTAAFHKVESCEEDPGKAFQVNATAVQQLAKVCQAHDAILVHISTDYVFDGQGNEPHGESDTANPVNAYGASKLAGEMQLRQTWPRHFIVRTSGLYGVAGASGKGGNFVELMVRLAREGKPIRVVNDQFLTPTYTRDLADKIRELIETKAFGTYHITNGGYCSWYEFAARIFAYLGLRPDFIPTTTAAFGAKVRRPMFSVLSNQALRDLGLEGLRPWTKALEAYLMEKGHLAMPKARAA